MLSNAAYGNRLRRDIRGAANRLSSGSFKNYIYPYRAWRDNGLRSMKRALNDGKPIVALTADAESFYHKLDSEFVRSSRFLSEIAQVSLTEEEQRLNNMFVDAMKNWSALAPTGRGLPVGLPASGVVANLAFMELDRAIMESDPIYYGRYVDDLLIVLENSSNLSSTTQVWDMLITLGDGKLSRAREPENFVKYETEYLQNSQIRFTNKKNRVFVLRGDSGLAMVDSIARNINERASEWRSLPSLPNGRRDISRSLLFATEANGDDPDNLRRTDSLTLKRSAFAMMLRDLEAFERDLKPEIWKRQASGFFAAFIEHVLVLPTFFDLSLYVPRVVKLAAACSAFMYIAKIVEAIDSIIADVRRDCEISVKAVESEMIAEEVLARWASSISTSVYDNICSACSRGIIDSNLDDFQNMIERLKVTENLPILIDYETVIDDNSRLFGMDLGHIPFRFSTLRSDWVTSNGIPPIDTSQLTNMDQLLDDDLLYGLGIMSQWTHPDSSGVPAGFAFATRPFNMAELYFIVPNPFEVSTHGDLVVVAKSLRGYTTSGILPSLDGGVLDLHKSNNPGSIRIAVSSWQTNEGSWSAAINGDPDPDPGRYNRLNSMINALIVNPSGVSYLILPELAVPSNWFVRIAQKLNDVGISLIAGIEYIAPGNKVVHNQAWVALNHRAWGFESMFVYRQDKQNPAPQEQKDLLDFCDVKLVPERVLCNPVVIEDENFFFSLQICSELTNIANRSALRGRVDALFVPEWNRDINSFDALVKSAALDIHAYIVQCNDRKYGDSRIRAPYAKTWLRDVVEVKGGVSDFFVIGEIDISSLRKFHSTPGGVDGPFKPMPDGFVTSDSRLI
ncbi:RNA-directed DNA polymerase [Rhodococcus sp. 1168]|uniref:RNA-directed DNA polymerase n=1 Tax=Rhodococcus sp. 1168 TaxID=2018041 RepID=UPI0015935F4B|nr:RNA-directed DNA polymerase [Rhodococcus sp. 1168]